VKNNENDKYLRHVNEIDTPLGMSAYDAVRLSPGPSLVRHYETIDGAEQKDFKKNGDFVLAKGAAVGLDGGGDCCHFAPGLKFVGFLEGNQNQGRCGVRTRGSVILKVEGATEADRKAPVYVNGPNDFSLERQGGAAEIGRIRFVQDGRAAVFFRSFNDNRPLILEV